jgi:uncharacterized protein
VSQTNLTRTAGSRIVSVDAVRGFALLGIVVAHMVEQYMGAPPPASRPNFGIFSTLDSAAVGLVQLFAVGKFFTMFSLLFGVSFFIQMDRAARRGVEFAGRFAWRLLVLFAIGMAHHLFYRGDILAVYAMLGLALIPFYRASDRTVLLASLVMLLGVHRWVLAAAGLALGTQVPMMSLDNPELEAYYSAIKSGWLPTLFWLNLRDGFLMKMEFQFSWFGRGYQTFGLFLLGLYIARHGWHERTAEMRRAVRRLTLGGLGLALVSAAIVATAMFVGGAPTSESDIRTWHLLVGLTGLDLVNLGLSAVLMGSFLLLYHSPRLHGALARLSPVGQTALTTYVCQTLVGTFVYYGHGFNLSGEIGAATALGLALAIFALQVLAATWWLTRFRYGPLEWFWRCATFGRLQPMRLDVRPAIAPSPASL